MKRLVGVVVALLTVTACSSSGSGTAASTTTSSTRPPVPVTVPPAQVEAAIFRLQADDVDSPPRAGTSDSDFSHHQLMKMPSVPIRKKSVRRELDSQLARAKAFAVAHPRLRDAQADGYLPQNFVDADGVHVVDWRLMNKKFDPAHPSMVIYESTDPGAKIVALSYVVESVGHEPAGFPGPNDHWHQHLGLCFKDGMLVPSAFKDRPKCEGLAGRYLSGTTLWMLHAWVVPGVKNPWGTFAIVNPRHHPRD